MCAVKGEPHRLNNIFNNKRWVTMSRIRVCTELFFYPILSYPILSYTRMRKYYAGGRKKIS
jgi:hypothetical protein